MPPRYDDDAKVLTLSVRDLVEAGPPSGHLVLEAAQSRAARMRAGREAHEAWQQAQVEADEAYRAEVPLKHVLELEGWTVEIQGRVDGLTEIGGRTIVEEIKSTALDIGRLTGTSAEDWPAWTAQLEVYLWMLDRSAWPEPTGRLVLVSLLDGSRHMLPVPYDADRVGGFVQDRCARLVRLRERRLAWFVRRRKTHVPRPFDAWRPGQEPLADTVRACLADGRRLLAQAPTGMGKTAAVLHGALAHALAHDRQIFWATSRNTQQAGVLATLQRFRDQGLPLTWAALRAKEKVCLNDVVACRPDTCAHARHHHDKVAAAGLVEAEATEGHLDPERAMDLGRTHEVCPFQLTVDVAEHVDVVVGDVNYAISPQGRLGRFFGSQTADGWVVIADEAHQLVERARDHLSPRIDAALADRAADAVDDDDAGAFRELAEDVSAAVHDVVRATTGPWQDGVAPAQLDVRPWRALARRVDALSFDHALWRAGRPPVEDDPWQDMARRVLSFSSAIEDADETSVALADGRPGRVGVRLLCLDAAPVLRPWWAELGGMVGCSATLTPHAFHRDLLGLPEDTARLELPSPFPPERRAVVVAPRVSTRYRDRARDADRTARLLSDVARATPGNTALYFPSFSMLDDLVGRLDLPDHRVIRQERGMSEDARAGLLAELAGAGGPAVLAAVLGGVFAEGVDLPAGALSAVCVVGPALPPVGLERDLLREHYERRFGEGWRYASLVPGMTRVVQAAGRLVRRDADRGVIVLVGRRFRWREHAELLPSDWTPTLPDDPVAAVRDFWEGTP